MRFGSKKGLGKGLGRGAARAQLPLLAAALLSAGAVIAAEAQLGVVGPESGIQPSGRKLDPVGRLTRLGNLPAGGALTVDGRFAWTLSAGRGRNDVRIVRVRPRGGCAENVLGNPPAHPDTAQDASRLRPRRKPHIGFAMRDSRRNRPARSWTAPGTRGDSQTRSEGGEGRDCREVGEVVQRIPMPGLSGGIAMSPDGRRAYVSGVPESSIEENQVGPKVPGPDGDAIHVFALGERSGRAKRRGVIEVPPPDGTLPPQSFPPTNTRALSWPRDLAISPDGKTLLAALNLADSAAVVDLESGEVRYVETGRYPYGAAIARDGRHGFVSNEADGTVSVIRLDDAQEVEEITVGPHLSHPEGIAADPRRPLAYVAVTHQDLIAVIDTESFEVERTLSVERPAGIGTAPVQLSVTADGCRLLSANSGEDAIAVFALSIERSCNPGAAARMKVRRWDVIGRVPVGSYPVAAVATPQPPERRRLVWIAAKGLGVGPNAIEPGQEIAADPGSATGDAQRRYRFEYLPSHVFGLSGVLGFPSDRRIARLTPRAARQIRPVNGQEPPPDTPIAAGGPIEHVFYVVRENRTYDQILGDDPRGDGDPKLTLFGEQVTPNVHALAERFPLLDHVYANSEASIDGHFWTSAAAVSDYVVKSWHQNYGGRQRPYDFGVYAVTWPSQRFLFDKAEEQGISYFNYGEAIAGTVPLQDRDRTAEENAQVAEKFASSDLGPVEPGPQPPPPAPCFSNDASAGGTNVITGQEVFDSTRPAGANPLDTESRFECLRQRFEQQLASPDGVPAFNYITLPNDHTAGTTPGARTPRAMIAENDLAVGQLVELISGSPIWESSLILVIEDDSQDGADHVDAHRIPALAIGPYARRGAVIHTRYDFLSFIRTLEIVIGMEPLNLFDATAVPMYDVFDADPSDNSEPYEAIVPELDLLERNSESAPNAALSERLPLDFTDRTPQRILDRILWQYVHGPDSEPPPPGPNAAGIDEARWRREGRVTDEQALAELLE